MGVETRELVSVLGLSFFVLVVAAILGWAIINWRLADLILGML